MKRLLSVLIAAVIAVCPLVLAASAADSPLTVYNIPDYENSADYGGVATHFLQGVDWGHIYSGDNDSILQLFWGTTKDLVASAPVLRIPISVAKAGSYQIYLQAYVGGDFGQFRVELGDVLLSEKTDFFGSGDLTYFDMGIHDLPAGAQELRFTLTGFNEGNTHEVNCILGVSRLVLCQPGYTDAGIVMRGIKTEGNEGFFFQDLSRDFKGDWNPHYVIAEDENQVFTGFKNANVGGKVRIPVTVPESGKYKVSVRAFKGGDFGKFGFEIGGKTLSDGYDWFGEGGLTTVELGEVELSAGKTEFVATLVGFNPDKDNDGANFAINSITLEKAVSSTDTGDTAAAALALAAVACAAGLCLVSARKKEN